MYGFEKKDSITYAYLGLVVTKDLVEGIIKPSYILCQSEGTRDTRSSWRIVKADNVCNRMSRLMVPNLLGNEDMVDFFSAYRRRDHMHSKLKRFHKKTLKYYPRGALFWFECNEYGEETGMATFIKRVPDKELIKNYGVDSGFSRMKQRWSKEPSIAEQIGLEPMLIPLQKNDVKKIVD